MITKLVAYVPITPSEYFQSGVGVPTKCHQNQNPFVLSRQEDIPAIWALCLTVLLDLQNLGPLESQIDKLMTRITIITTTTVIITITVMHHHHRDHHHHHHQQRSSGAHTTTVKPRYKAPSSAWHRTLLEAPWTKLGATKSYHQIFG